LLELINAKKEKTRQHTPFVGQECPKR